MNFFEHQYRARRRTWLLVTYFLLAVLLIVVSVNLAVFLAFFAAGTQTGSQVISPADWLTGPISIGISLVTLVVIVLGSLHTIVKLRGGGRALADMVGARRINPNTSDLGERRLVNVVEEMSIASGTPVPELYIMEDPAINAFVAGYRPTDVVMVVTSGALESFSRDELQGVVGHEYSHIFNGDMRINIRLMGILAGILLIGQIGGFIMRSSGRRRRSSSKGGGQIIILGIALFIIGYIGLFFGSLIKAAVSRQREFLADASSVQFTRNPDGIAGALFAIKQNSEGSKLTNAHAEDVSHFCFGDPVTKRFSSMLATHPPLEDRIRAINPRFDFTRKRQRPVVQNTDSEEAVAKDSRDAATGMTGAVIAAAVVASATAEQVRDSVGQVQAQHLEYGERIHAEMPQIIKAIVHDPETVRQLLYAIVITGMKEEDRHSGLELLRQEGSSVIADETGGYMQIVSDVDQKYRLPVINMSIPVLKSLETDQRKDFMALLEKLVMVDRRFTIFEFALVTIIREQLAADAGREVSVKYFKYNQVINEINLLLSVLVRVGTGDQEQAIRIHTSIIQQFDCGSPAMLGSGDCKLESISRALQKLNQVTPLLKQTIIQAFADCVIHDGKIKAQEAELLQAISISIDCPMPPLLV